MQPFVSPVCIFAVLLRHRCEKCDCICLQEGVAGNWSLESMALCMARILHGRLSCRKMLTDSLYTPSQFLHSPLESEPDVLAVLMAERRPRYFMLMLSLGLGPAFPMNLNKGSRKLHFQAFDRLLPVQKQRGGMLCILACSSPAGFSLLIVLSCAFIFCREKTIDSLCWEEMLWTKWSQYCSPSQRLAPSGPVLSEKRHIRDNTEFDVFKLPDSHHEFLLLLITDLPPSSISRVIDHGVSMTFMLQRECHFLLSPV